MNFLGIIAAIPAFIKLIEQLIDLWKKIEESIPHGENEKKRSFFDPAAREIGWRVLNRKLTDEEIYKIREVLCILMQGGK